MPEANHDENSRMNFISNLNVHIGSSLFPGVSNAFAKRVRPKFIKKYGREPLNSIEVRKAIASDYAYQSWAAIRRNTMEMRHQVGRSIVFRQLDSLIDKARSLNSNCDSLRLDNNVKIPDYLAAVDNHCMPGSYYQEVVEDDISAPANYEAGHYTTVAGGTGPKSDIVGRTMVEWLHNNFSGISPEIIFDVGAGAGINTLPIASNFQRAKIYAIDVAAPMLRYGHARAKSMEYENVIFKQADFEMMETKDESVDMVVSAMFFHEVSSQAMRNILKKIYSILKPGGLMLHMEQPNFDSSTSAYEKFVRDWDAWYNGEPYWANLHNMDVMQEMVIAGFDKKKTFEASQKINRRHETYPSWSAAFSRHAHEAKMRESKKDLNPKNDGGMYMFGATK